MLKEESIYQRWPAKIYEAFWVCSRYINVYCFPRKHYIMLLFLTNYWLVKEFLHLARKSKHYAVLNYDPFY